MKSKKMLLILIFAAMIAGGWIISVRSVTGTDVIKQQKELLAEADAFMDRKLYVRAIPLYEEAVQGKTELTDSIQEKLLTAYLGHEDMDSYAKLVLVRIQSGKATEEEYQNVVQYYLQQMKLTEAISMLKEGIELLNSDALRQLYEDNRYTYNIRTTKYQEILPSAMNQEMPAYNGEKWGYVDESGREQIPCIYDSATVFNGNGYAVVHLNDTYYTILSTGDTYGADDGSSYDRMTDVLMINGSHILGQRGGTYSYYNYDFAPVAATHQYTDMTGNACGAAAVQKDGKWGIITDAGAAVTDFVYEDVAVNSLGCAFAGDRAMVKENGAWHLIDTEGKQVGTGTYANAKAPESAGYIAVADGSGQWGFITSEGEQVIPFQYQDALSFSQHLGAVKIVNDWGYISENNELVIKEPFQSAQPFHNGIAQAGLTEGVALISLKYFED